MDIHERLGLSLEAYNRLAAWEMALELALSYLAVGTDLVQRAALHDDWCHYMAGDRRAKARTVFVARRGLTDAAVVLLRQVFSTGASGPGFADNQVDPEIRALRDEMQQGARDALGWTDEDYRAFFRLLRDSRNEQLAHYDGGAAGYHEPTPQVSAMKMVGANLGESEVEMLRVLLGALLEWLQRRTRPAE